MSTDGHSRAWDDLRRWEAAGGAWRVEAWDGDVVEIALLTCATDEVMGRLSTSAPDVLALVSGPAATTLDQS